MQIQPFTCNPFQTNSYVCYDEDDAVIIDASFSTDAEFASLERFIEKNELTVRHLLLTHGHIDHILGCRRLVDTFGLHFQMHRDDAPLLANAEMQAKMFGIRMERPPDPGGYLREGDTIEVGSVHLKVIHTPGHSPGSISFFDEGSRSVFAGDVLFRGSIGRTDLWQASLPQLMQSIFQKLIPLGDDVRVYPGHGPATTVGQERQTNPFLTHGSPTF